MKKQLPRIAAIVFCFAPLSCGGAEDGSPQLVVGTVSADRTTFVPIKDGQPATLTLGIQGGFHVWLQIRMKNLFPEELILQRAVKLENGSEISHASEVYSTLVPAADEEGWFELPAARPAIVCPSSVFAPGKRVRLEVKAIDSRERTAMADAVVIPTCPSDDPAAGCITICSP